MPGFCRAFPLEVIADLLGVADEDREAFASMGNAMVDFNGGLFAIIKMVRTIGKFWHFVGQMVRDMRINPQPGLVTDLIEVEAEGEQLTEDELVSMIFLLMFAGFETTTHLISGSVIALDQNPDQRAGYSQILKIELNQQLRNYAASYPLFREPNRGLPQMISRWMGN